MLIRVSELRRLIQEAYAGVPRGGYFHLSSKDLGPQFTFTPRLPNEPFRDDDDVPIEDFHTLRTSWAPSIEKATNALDSLKDVMYVYYVPSLPGRVDLRKELPKCPKSPKNPYGRDFSSRKWKEWHDPGFGDKAFPDPTDKPKSSFRQRIVMKNGLADELQDELTNCVPDVVDTREVWATEPVTATKLGSLHNASHLRPGRFIPVSQPSSSSSSASEDPEMLARIARRLAKKKAAAYARFG